MSFDIEDIKGALTFNEFQSLWNRAMSFDVHLTLISIEKQEFQSLWNRAMSFDDLPDAVVLTIRVSIPLEQGNVFRHKLKDNQIMGYRLNPFGTGQCLSTI